MRLCQMYNGLISYICSMYEKNPEEETFKTFFLKYHDVLVLYAASILKNVDAAEDVVLGCFVQAWESSLYKKLSDGLDKYMFHVVKNAALNELRDCKRRKTRHEKMMEGMPVAEIMHEDEQTEIDVLYFAINQLPPERRRIFMMVYAEGKKYKEVAEHLQISINTVRTQLSRSLKFLRGKLDCGIARMDAGKLDMLRDCICNDFAIAGHGIHLHLLCVLEESGHHHRVALRHISRQGEESFEFLARRANIHSGAGKHVRGAHQYGESHAVDKAVDIIHRSQCAPFRLVHPDAAEHGGELLAVLGIVDAFGGGAEQGHSLLIEAQR